VTVAIFVCLACAAAFGPTVAVLCRRLPPGIATWLLSTGSVISAAATCTALGLLSSPWLVQIPLVADVGEWSRPALAAGDPVFTPLAAAAAAILAVSMARGTSEALRAVRRLTAIARLVETLPTDRELYVVCDDQQRRAFALPGRPGHIVVTSALLKALDAAERRALLAHERAHLTRHHHLHLVAVRIAAAASPLLSPAARAAALSCERWADELAATGVGRTAVAAALTKAAGHLPAGGPNGSMAMAASHVEERVQALYAPRPRVQSWRLLVPTLLLISMLVCDGDAAARLTHLLEFAELH
jgi:Zn-dependent protease with chaperone function